MSDETKKPKSKATYNTKKQTIEAMKWAVSDERRMFHQKRQRELHHQGLTDPIPWATAIRSITEEDYRMWKEGTEDRAKEFTAEDLERAYMKGINDELKRWRNGSSD